MEMDVRIEVNEQEAGCKVWLDQTAISFAKVEEAQAYVAQLEARLNASPLSARTRQRG